MSDSHFNGLKEPARNAEAQRGKPQG